MTDDQEPLTVGDIRALIADLPDDAPVELYMTNDPPDNLAIELDGMICDGKRNVLELHVSITDTEEDEE